MQQTLLTQLCDALNRLGGMTPAIPCPELFDVLDALFTEDEAAVAAKMPPAARSLEDLSRYMDRPAETLLPLLESMAGKGIVLTREKDGVTLYRLMPLMPGIFEFQFMRGEDSPHYRDLAQRFQKYLDMTKPEITRKFSAIENPTAFSRILPVEKTIQAGQKVFTFDQVSRYIDSADAIAVGHCYCRQYAKLLGETPCDAPRESCMSFGPGARFTAERGIARLISKEEAYQILRDCEEKGLVHLTSNTSAFLEYMCNCCGCHCDILKKLKETGSPIWVATSGYQAVVDEDACIGCGTCEEKCQLQAIALDEDEKARVDAARCIGCGVCANLCPVDAVFMDPLEGIAEPPQTARDLRKAVLASMETKA